MPIRKRQDLYNLFATGNKPTHDDFVDLIDSMINLAEDGIGISEKGRPMEIVEQGSKRRLLDFSSSRDTPIWRINAQSADGNRSGLNVSSANQSRLFVRQDNGFTGINNDAPGAKLHISPDIGPAFRVDDESKEISFIIEADGKVGIGTDVQDDYKLSVDGNVYLKGETTMDGPVYARDGIVVNGAKLLAEQGLRVKNGVTIESGLLEVKEGLTANGPVYACAGAVVDGLPLEAAKGLIIKEGAIVETGVLTANAGLVVNGALTVNDEMVVNAGPLVAKKGLTVSDGPTSINGELLATKGLTVDNSTMEANGQVFLGNEDNGTVTSYGEFIAKKGIILENPVIRGGQGIIFSEGDLSVAQNLSVSGELSTNGGLTVNDSILQATGQVILGNADNGDITVEGSFIANKGIIVREGTVQAHAGAVITGAKLQVENGLRVKEGAFIEDGLLTVNQGILLAENSILNANGQVNLGNMNNGVVTVNGELRAVNGAIITGADLQVQNGLVVNGCLNAPDEANLGIASIQSLRVGDIDITGNLGLTSLYLASLSADGADIQNLNIGNNLNVNGQCMMVNDVVLAGGKIVVTYEGTENDTPKITIKKGIVTAETGHFDFDIDSNKQVTITYDDSSDLTNFITDWKMYQYAHPGAAESFNFLQIGPGSGSFKDEEIELIPATTAFKEYRIAKNGLRIIYTGEQAGTPQFMILKNTDQSSSTRFDFTIQGLVLGIFCPNNDEDRTVNNLLACWENWKSINQDLAADFEIRQSGDEEWQLNDILEVQNLVPTGDVIREYKLGELIIRNTSNVQNQPRLIVSAAVPSFGEEVGIAASLDTLSITLGTIENSPQAVYNAWNNWVKSGNETYGFEIVETSNITPIQVYQEENLTSTDDTHSEIEVAGIAVTYTGDEAGMAKVIFQEGSGDGFSFNINDQNKELTINYPANINERIVSSLLAAWEGVTEKHGFEIYGRSEELFVRQEEALETRVAEIKEYEPTTKGVDNMTIRYTGPGADTPGVIIQANSTNDFYVSISEDKVITIKYPQDKSGTINDLMAYWDGLTPVERDGFSLIKHEIGHALVEETSGELVVNAGNKIFSEGIIRTNTVTIEGRFAFGDSGIEIRGISNDQALSEDSDTLLSTQKAVKAYVDSGLALKADQSFVNVELGKKADRSFVTDELVKKADLTYVAAELVKKADLSYVTEELEKKAAQNFVTEELTKKADLIYVNEELAEKADQNYVREELEKKADQSYVTQELERKADLSMMATALAAKANVATSENLSVGQGAIVIVDGFGLTPDRSGLLLVMITTADYGGAGLFALDGTERLLRIVGDGLSDRQDNPDTCNVYLYEGNVVLQNALPEEVTAKVVYFGT